MLLPKKPLPLPWPLVSTITYINYDIQGANLLPSLKNFSFSVGAETGTGLPTLVQQAATGITLDLRLLSAVFGQFRSDYTNFIVSGVSTVFFSDSTGPCYHTTGDEVEIVDLGKLEEQVRLGYDLTLSGHTHGGQLGWLGRSVFERLGIGALEQGWWEAYSRPGGTLGPSRLYTTSGFGHWFPFRFGCPREMPTVVLERPPDIAVMRA